MMLRLILCRLRKHKKHIRQEFDISSKGLRIRYKKYCPICDKKEYSWKLEAYDSNNNPCVK